MEEELINEIPEHEIDSILDWYDQALANGQGFKSEEEREAYFAEIGDPLKHPLWAESMEDLEGNPMVDAFRLLREEDKTKVELVLMYKDEGNQFIRKKTTKERHEAIKRYSYALQLLDNADLARKEGTEDEQDKSVNLHHLRSQIYNNRALALMYLKNYGLAIKDLSMALLYQNENVKAHYRKSKCLFQLKKNELALRACEVGLNILYTHSPDDKDSEREFVLLKEQCEKEIKRLNEIRRVVEETNRAKDLLWKQAWEIANRNNVKLGPCPKYWKSPPQLQQHIPYYTSPPTDLSENWPIIVLYPQYSQIDVIQGTSSDTMLVMLLAEMFPEDEGNGLSCVEWDKKGEYHVSNLIVFIQLNMAQQYHDETSWIEHRRQREKNRNGNDDDECDEKNNNESKESNYNPSYKMEILEIHLGCTIQQILTAPNHILAGGVLSLTVFPKNSQSLKLFLKQYDNNYKILQPNGVVSEKK